MYDYVRVDMRLPNVAYGHPIELQLNANSLFQTKSLGNELKLYVLSEDGVLLEGIDKIGYTGSMVLYTFHRHEFGVSEATVLGYWYEFKAIFKKGVIENIELIRREALSRGKVGAND